jgi:hypothetical protein
MEKVVMYILAPVERVIFFLFLFFVYGSSSFVYLLEFWGGGIL